MACDGLNSKKVSFIEDAKMFLYNRRERKTFDPDFDFEEVYCDCTLYGSPVHTGVSTELTLSCSNEVDILRFNDLIGDASLWKDKMRIYEVRDIAIGLAEA